MYLPEARRNVRSNTWGQHVCVGFDYTFTNYNFKKKWKFKNTTECHPSGNILFKLSSVVCKYSW